MFRFRPVLFLFSRCCQWIKQPLSRCNAAIMRTSKWMVFIQLAMWCYFNVIRKFFTIPFAFPFDAIASKGKKIYQILIATLSTCLIAFLQAKWNRLTSITMFCRCTTWVLIEVLMSLFQAYATICSWIVLNSMHIHQAHIRTCFNLLINIVNSQ